MWTLGWQETMVIFLLALLLFGPKKLPELGKNIAKGLAEFRRASNDLKSTFDREMANIERETGSLKEVTQQYQNEITNYDSYYENSYYDSGYNNTSLDPAKESSTVSASATQGAESSAAPENGTASPAVATNGSHAEPAAPEAGSSSQVAQADAAPAPDAKPVPRA